MSDEIKNNETENMESTPKTKTRKNKTVKENPEEKTTKKKTSSKKTDTPAENVSEIDISKTSNEKSTKKKSTSKKTTVKKEVENSQNIYVEYQGKQYEQQDIINRVKDAWAQSGHRIASIKTLDIYIKPEDNAVYYVVNGKAVKEPIQL